MVYHSQFNITNSFHAVAFSLIFEKQFIVINRQEAINTRMRDLLQIVKLKHLVKNYEEYLNLAPIVYKEPTLLLKDKIVFSKKFLSNALNLAK